MKPRRKFLIVMLAAICLATADPRAFAEGDLLYIGCGGDNTIRAYDADTGDFLFASDGPEVSGLAGPRGIVVDGDDLLVVNQNVNLDVAGEVLRFSVEGFFLGALVPFSNPNAPFAPDGIVIAGNGDLLVGSVLRKSNLGPPGRVMQYSGNGEFVAEAKVKNNEHHPRGVVFGPDGRLYVSTRDLKNGLGGTILCYGVDGKPQVFVDDKGGFGKLNRPDGLVFGPDGCLYVTSFRAAPGDTDSIRIYDQTGRFIAKIDLHNGTTEPRVLPNLCSSDPRASFSSRLTMQVKCGATIARPRGTSAFS